MYHHPTVHSKRIPPRRLTWFRLMMLMCLIGLNLTPQTAKASGVPYTVGDVFAGVGDGKIKHFSSSGVLLDTLDTTTGSLHTTGMAFDLPGNLYSTNWDANSMSKFDNQGNLLGPFGSGFGSNNPESVVVNAAGDLYVGLSRGSHQLLKFNANGTLLGSFSPAAETAGAGTDWIDLAADQCTLLYTSEGKLIKRFNVCSGTQLSNFTTLPISGIPDDDAAYALRIRPNGEIMVATSQKVFRLNAIGTIIQTYPKPAGETSILFALNLDPDLTSFWTAGFDSGNIYKIDITTGALLQSFNAGILGGGLGGLAVFGEITAAQPKLILTPTTDTKSAGTTETLTAELINVVNPAGTIVTFTVTGANAQTGTAAADATGKATFTYTGNNIGIDTVVATATTILPPASLTSNSAIITWVDTTPPVAACIPTTNPSGKNIPRAGKNPKSGQNPDGFYELTATDLVDPNPQIFIHDSASNFVAGPFDNGTKIKLVQAPGAKPKVKPGAGVIDWKIKLKGDALLVAVDASGNVAAPVSCLVPPPPK
jgi:hypothetical protein